MCPINILQDCMYVFFRNECHVRYVLDTELLATVLKEMLYFVNYCTSNLDKNPSQMFHFHSPKTQTNDDINIKEIRYPKLSL